MNQTFRNLAKLLPVYLASLVRSIVALHGLINNKIQNSTPPEKVAPKKTEETEKPAVAVK